MLNKNINKVIELIQQFMFSRPELFITIIRETMLEILAEKPQVLVDVVSELLRDSTVLGTVGLELDKAKAARISQEIGIRVDELREKEIEMANSPEPWFEMVTVGYDEELGDKMEFAWNPAWIQLLKKRNIPGNTQEQIVQNWVAFLNADLIMEHDKW